MEVEDDLESVVSYLAMINDFIKVNLHEEMTDFAKVPPLESPETPEGPQDSLSQPAENE